MSNRLENKIVLVTGGARGIGAAVCEVFSNEGATVIVTDILQEQGQQLAKSLNNNSVFYALDVAVESEWQSLTDYVLKEFGRLDALVNNAGITGLAETEGAHDPENFELESWHQVHAINLDGVALGCKYGIKMMKTSKAASIVNISSRSGMVGIPGAAAYASSKAAIRNHSKTVALHCASHGYPIRCNSIHPGAILTPIWDAMLGEGPDREEAIKHMASEIPIGHMGEPNDVAYAALFLASDESKYITGSELTIDGGILAGSSASPGSADED